jgi:hypothetical protein
LYTELLDVSSPETEDTILEGMLRHGYGLDPFEIETMAEFFEVHERLEARVREGTLLIPDALSELRRMETKIATVSPESRADLWALLGMTCETLAKTAAPDQKAGVRRTADRYNDLAKQAEYLIDPISNPWD